MGCIYLQYVSSDEKMCRRQGNFCIKRGDFVEPVSEVSARMLNICDGRKRLRVPLPRVVENSINQVQHI